MPTPTADPWAGVKPDLGTPVYTGFFAVTPGVALPFPTRGLFVGGDGGAVSIVDMFGVTTVINIPASVVGMALPFRVSAVNSSGTTATGIIGLY